MYTTPIVKILLWFDEDVVCSSKWKDENVDDDGWT